MSTELDRRRHTKLTQETAANTKASADADTRSSGQKDRDRVQYTGAFMRLGGVTQVVGATEGHVFHNRLTHTLEVAQLARRFAERYSEEYRPALKPQCRIDPDVAEAAALAHDLGHPPFGHVAEDELNTLVINASGAKDLTDTRYDGYEGNAQSFRIVSRLAAHQTSYRGLNLTRATLNAMLKYPWTRDGAPEGYEKKYGAYRSEIGDFKFARGETPETARSPEAEIMDHADNIAYSVHDVLDFYRAGLIPLEIVAVDPIAEIEGYRKHLEHEGKAQEATRVAAHADNVEAWVKSRFPRQRYTGDSTQRHALRALGSELIQRFVGTTVFEFGKDDEWPRIKAAEQQRVEMKFLQRLVWKYVIDNPRLATQQHGQRTVIKTLFNAYNDAIAETNDTEARRLLPTEFMWQLDFVRNGEKAIGGDPAQLPPNPQTGAARLAADVVASFTDVQATKVYQRITGMAPGSITDLLRG